MMTQEQLIATFRDYPTKVKASVLQRLMRDFERDLVEEALVEEVGREELTARRRLAIERLRGIAAVPGKTPPTDEEWREERTNYLLEKHK